MCYISGTTHLKWAIMSTIWASDWLGFRVGAQRDVPVGLSLGLVFLFLLFLLRGGQPCTLFILVMINVCGGIVFTRMILPSKYGSVGEIKMCSFLGGCFFFYVISTSIQGSIMCRGKEKLESIFSNTNILSFQFFLILPQNIFLSLSFFIFFLSLCVNHWQSAVKINLCINSP